MVHDIGHYSSDAVRALECVISDLTEQAKKDQKAIRKAIAQLSLIDETCCTIGTWDRVCIALEALEALEGNDE